MNKAPGEGALLFGSINFEHVNSHRIASRLKR